LRLRSETWLLDGDAGEAHRRATGGGLDRITLDFFRLAWDLRDSAEYISLLRCPHDENADTVKAYGARIATVHACWECPA
jgi:hypothetical protein